MTLFLAMEPLDFLLRYTVFAGVIIMIIGTALCMTAKRVTMAVKKQVEINKKDRLYVTLMLLGLAFIMIGMIIMVLPIEATFYRG
ncbi:MAG: hypothetical protein J6Q13_00435 [Clostridia bacterium]|nr:hypothetical protein [Clostridia bacterium]